MKVTIEGDLSISACQPKLCGQIYDFRHYDILINKGLPPVLTDMALVADIPRRTLALPCYVVALCPVFAVTHLLTALAPECWWKEGLLRFIVI